MALLEQGGQSAALAASRDITLGLLKAARTAQV